MANNKTNNHTSKDKEYPSSSSSSTPFSPMVDDESGEGQILYALVGYCDENIQNEIQCFGEYSILKGNFGQVTRNILERIPNLKQSSIRKSIAYDRFVYHCRTERMNNSAAAGSSSLSSGRLLLVCLADKSLGVQVPFLFLDSLFQRYVKELSSVQTLSVSGRSIEDLIRDELFKSKLLLSNNNPSDDNGGGLSSINRVKGKLAVASSTMIENIDRILERQERIEILIEKTDVLSRTAAAFRREAVDFRRAIWWRDVKVRVYIGILLGVVILIVVLFFILNKKDGNQHNSITCRS